MLKKWMIAVFSVLLLLAGCSGGQDESAKKHKEKQFEGSGKVEYPYHYPLTGIGTFENPTARAIAVMINNHPQARPQSGLNKADIVYELLAEAEVTRFLAIYQSEQEGVAGPVRSARHYYIKLAAGYDALFIAHGYSPQAKQMLDNRYIDHINGMQYDGTLFKRSSARKAPHNSYISFENIYKGAEMHKYAMNTPPSSLTFLSSEEVEAMTGAEAESATVNFSGNSLFTSIYKFDKELGKYKRYVRNDLTVDLDTKEPVLIDNVFIVETTYRVIDSAGRREVDLTSGGNAYLLQKGFWKKVEWRNLNGRILPYENGAVAGLVPGKTWICVIPKNPGLERAVTLKTAEE